MKICRVTGKITFSSGQEVGAFLSRADFLGGPISLGATRLVENEPYVSYAINAPDESMSVSIFFKGEVLESIELAVLGSEFDTSWNDWSKEKEMSRKAANDAWLFQQGLSSDVSYDWGTVWSGFDPKGGFSPIVIRYAAAANNSLQGRRP